MLAFGITLLLVRNDPRAADTVNSAEVSLIEENRFENTDFIPKNGPNRRT